ncbi:ion transporter [Adhaeribacter soli]|uniref:Ion transporter n=1 Tax=Adhaeribacter soli TaxID=2607655 RepID=A0A5N1IWP0_9BACT|nr:ion transporter [Adhaeribacter soli]KAA9333566.1 ion transporter [Adhaeribacter soli]
MEETDQEKLKEELAKERNELLWRIQNFLEGPLVVLGFVWLVLLVIELLWSLNETLLWLSYAIWGIFIFDFLMKLILAPDKTQFLKSNVITIISLMVPAIRVFRIGYIFQSVRAIRGLRLVKVVGSLNRSMRNLSATMGRRGFGYVLVLTIVVIFIGAAGMYAFENDTENGLKTYPDALWWTAMLLITIGSDYWPASHEGRVLCFLLSLYGFAVFGYFTATMASFFVGQDAEADDSDVASAHQIDQMHAEVKALREEIKELLESRRLKGGE